MEIDLGKGLVALIDDEDADLIAGFKWYPMKAPQAEAKYYAAGWKHLPPGRFFVHLHRLIMNAQPGQKAAAGPGTPHEQAPVGGPSGWSRIQTYEGTWPAALQAVRPL